MESMEAIELRSQSRSSTGSSIESIKSNDFFCQDQNISQNLPESEDDTTSGRGTRGGMGWFECMTNFEEFQNDGNMRKLFPKKSTSPLNSYKNNVLCLKELISFSKAT